MTAVRGEVSGARSSAMALARRADRWSWRTLRTSYVEGSGSDKDAREHSIGCGLRCNRAGDQGCCGIGGSGFEGSRGNVGFINVRWSKIIVCGIVVDEQR